MKKIRIYEKLKGWKLKWYVAGWDDLDLARKWYEAGWDNPTSAMGFYEAGWLDPILALEWKKSGWSGIDADYALKYYNKGFDPSEALHFFEDEGLRPDEALEMMKNDV